MKTRMILGFACIIASFLPVISEGYFQKSITLRPAPGKERQFRQLVKQVKNDFKTCRPEDNSCFLPRLNSHAQKISNIIIEGFAYVPAYIRADIVSGCNPANLGSFLSCTRHNCAKVIGFYQKNTHAPLNGRSLSKTESLILSMEPAEIDAISRALSRLGRAHNRYNYLQIAGGLCPECRVSGLFEWKKYWNKVRILPGGSVGNGPAIGGTKTASSPDRFRYFSPDVVKEDENSSSSGSGAGSDNTDKSRKHLVKPEDRITLAEVNKICANGSEEIRINDCRSCRNTRDWELNPLDSKIIDLLEHGTPKASYFEILRALALARLSCSAESITGSRPAAGRLPSSCKRYAYLPGLSGHSCKRAPKSVYRQSFTPDYRKAVIKAARLVHQMRNEIRTLHGILSEIERCGPSKDVGGYGGSHPCSAFEKYPNLKNDDPEIIRKRITEIRNRIPEILMAYPYLVAGHNTLKDRNYENLHVVDRLVRASGITDQKTRERAVSATFNLARRNAWREIWQEMKRFCDTDETDWHDLVKNKSLTNEVLEKYPEFRSFHDCSLKQAIGRDTVKKGTLAVATATCVTGAAMGSAGSLIPVCLTVIPLAETASDYIEAQEKLYLAGRCRNASEGLICGQSDVKQAEAQYDAAVEALSINVALLALDVPAAIKILKTLKPRISPQKLSSLASRLSRVKSREELASVISDARKSIKPEIPAILPKTEPIPKSKPKPRPESKPHTTWDYETIPQQNPGQVTLPPTMPSTQSARISRDFQGVRHGSNKYLRYHHNPGQDPYFTLEPGSFTRPEGYSYKAPTYISYAEDATSTTGRIMPEKIRFVTGSHDEAMREILLNRPGKTYTHLSKTANKTTTGTAEIYYVHSPLPYGYKGDTTDYIIKHSEEVVKIRKHTQHGTSMAAEMMRRDLMMYRIAGKLADGARLNNSRFIRVAKLRSNFLEHSRGIMRQETVRGTRVDKIARAIQCHRKPGICDASELLETKNVLSEAGLTRNGKPSRKMVEEMENRLNALEMFFRDTHNDAIEFQLSNTDIVMSNSMKNGKDYQYIGLDYNHGKNVVYDTETQMMVIVDW